MDLKKFTNQMFKEIVQEYENEKMINEGGYVKKTTVNEFLGGLDNV